MSTWDDVLGGLTGAAGGLAGGGIAGLLGGGLAGGLLNRGQSFNLGRAAQSGLAGYGAGQLSSAVGRGLESLKTSGGGSALGDLWSGLRRGDQTQVVSGLKGIGSGLGGMFSGGGTGLKNLYGKARGLFGGTQQQGQQQQSGEMQPGQGNPFGGQMQGRLGGLDGLDTLGMLGGGAMLGLGLSKNVPDVDLAGIYSGTPQDTQSRIEAAIADEQARRKAAEDIYTQQRGTARQALEAELGANTSEAMRQAIQSRQQQLNAQGLLGGPSGALDFALAQEAGNVRRANLPALLSFDEATQQGLSGMRQTGLEGELGLGRAGLERTFGLTDQQRAASLYQQLLNQAQQRQKQQQLLSGGGRLLGGGLGLPQGTLESIFGAIG